MSDAKIKQAVDELLSEPQGINDSDMPMQPQPPGFSGEVGSSPTADTIPPGDPSLAGDKPLTATGEEPDPAVFDAGGVDAPDTDGFARVHPEGD